MFGTKFGGRLLYTLSTKIRRNAGWKGRLYIRKVPKFESDFLKT